jgi:hypothetical protein
MDFEEEKKDWEDDIGVEGSSKKSKDHSEGSEDCEEEEDCDDCEEEDEELGGLPQEVPKEIADSFFDKEEELQTALDEAGFGDLPVILLDGKPRLVMPSPQHNKFTRSYNAEFEKFWAKNRWGASGESHKIFLSTNRSRDPDLSYWGYPRCAVNAKGDLQPVDGSVPDVIIQFSWRNTQRYEEDAINDMMNFALDEERGSISTTRPTLGYLIKVKFSKKRTLEVSINGSKTQDMEGLDIYRLPHGTTIAEARDPNNPNASHWHYVPGGPECLITITPGDLGITGFWALMCGEYRIKASDVFEEMQKFHRERQAKGLAT